PFVRQVVPAWNADAAGNAQRTRALEEVDLLRSGPQCACRENGVGRERRDIAIDAPTRRDRCLKLCCTTDCSSRKLRVSCLAETLGEPESKPSRERRDAVRIEAAYDPRLHAVAQAIGRHVPGIGVTSEVGESPDDPREGRPPVERTPLSSCPPC